MSKPFFYTPSIQESPTTTLPALVKRPKDSYAPWGQIPLGVAQDGTEARWDVSSAPHALVSGPAGSGKSNLQDNVIHHLLQHSDRWRLLGVDMTQVGMNSYEKHGDVVKTVAKNVPDGLEVLRYVYDVAIERNGQMRSENVNHFTDLSSRPKAVMVVVDEIYMFLSPSGLRSSEEAERDAQRSEAARIITRISELGRSAGVHLLLSTQRPDAKIIHGMLADNLVVRIAAGRMDFIASQLALGNETAAHLPSVRGRGVFQEHGRAVEFQGYYAEQV